MGVAGVKSPAKNQISDVNYSIVSHRPQCRAQISQKLQPTCRLVGHLTHFSYSALVKTELVVVVEIALVVVVFL